MRSCTRSVRYLTLESRRLKHNAPNLTSESGMRLDPAHDALQDQFLINLEDEWQRRWWSSEFGITPEALIEAVALVGPRSKAVREHVAASDQARG